MAQDPLALPDLAVRSFGGAVVWANDELFAGRENLVTPGPAVFTPRTFGAKGQVYDGWETRRRRDLAAGDADQAIVRLGAPGVVRAVVVDTSHFTGNFPTQASVDGVALEGAPSVDTLRAADWTPLVERSALKGDTANVSPVYSPRRWTHVRLNNFPDGGVARLRVHGEVVADPRVVEALGTVDLAALELGGRVTGCSNLFYGSPARGSVRVVELDTTWFLGNAPGAAAVSAHDGDGRWSPLLPRTVLQPDTRHCFVLPEPAAAATDVRLDVYPDGGMARLRLWGTPTADGLAALQTRWDETR